MLVVHNRLSVPPDYAAHLEDAFLKRTSLLREVPGFISFELLKPVETGVYVVATHWESRAAFDQWVAGDAFQKAHSGANPKSPVRSEVEIFEIVSSIP